MRAGDTFRFNAACKCGEKFSTLASYQWAPGRTPRVDFWLDQAGAEFECCRDGGNRLEYVCRCGLTRYARPVVGRFIAGKTCNAKCLASTGHQCECACGGKNHGAGHETHESPTVAIPVEKMRALMLGAE